MLRALPEHPRPQPFPAGMPLFQVGEEVSESRGFPPVPASGREQWWHAWSLILPHGRSLFPCWWVSSCSRSAPVLDHRGDKRLKLLLGGDWMETPPVSPVRTSPCLPVSRAASVSLLRSEQPLVAPCALQPGRQAHVQRIPSPGATPSICCAEAGDGSIPLSPLSKSIRALSTPSET